MVALMAALSVVLMAARSAVVSVVSMVDLMAA